MSPIKSLILALVFLASTQFAFADEKPTLNEERTDAGVNYTVAGEGSFNNVMQEVLALRNSSVEDNDQIVEELRDKVNVNPAPYMIELSRRLVNTNPDEARLWLNLFTVRARYDALRCIDRTARQGVTVTQMTLGVPEFGPLVQDRDVMSASLEELLQRDDLFASNASPWWICSHGMQAMSSAISGQDLLEEDWLLDESRWSEAEREIRDSIAKSLAK